MVVYILAYTFSVWLQGQETLIWRNVTLDSSERAGSLELGSYQTKEHAVGGRSSSPLSPSGRSISVHISGGFGYNWLLCVLHKSVKEKSRLLRLQLKHHLLLLLKQLVLSIAGELQLLLNQCLLVNTRLILA